MGKGKPKKPQVGPVEEAQPPSDGVVEDGLAMEEEDMITDPTPEPFDETDAGKKAIKREIALLEKRRAGLTNHGGMFDHKLAEKIRSVTKRIDFLRSKL